MPSGINSLYTGISHSDDKDAVFKNTKVVAYRGTELIAVHMGI